MKRDWGENWFLNSLNAAEGSQLEASVAGSKGKCFTFTGERFARYVANSVARIGVQDFWTVTF